MFINAKLERCSWSMVERRYVITCLSLDIDLSQVLMISNEMASTSEDFKIDKETFLLCLFTYFFNTSLYRTWSRLREEKPSKDVSLFWIITCSLWRSALMSTTLGMIRWSYIWFFFSSLMLASCMPNTIIQLKKTYIFIVT